MEFFPIKFARAFRRLEWPRSLGPVAMPSPQAGQFNCANVTFCATFNRWYERREAPVPSFDLFIYLFFFFEEEERSRLHSTVENNTPDSSCVSSVRAGNFAASYFSIRLFYFLCAGWRCLVVDFRFFFSVSRFRRNLLRRRFHFLLSPTNVSTIDKRMPMRIVCRRCCGANAHMSYAWRIRSNVCFSRSTTYYFSVL